MKSVGITARPLSRMAALHGIKKRYDYRLSGSLKGYITFMSTNDPGTLQGHCVIPVQNHRYRLYFNGSTCFKNVVLNV